MSDNSPSPPDLIRQWLAAAEGTPFVKVFGCTPEGENGAVLTFQSAVLRHTRIDVTEALCAVERLDSRDLQQLSPADQARIERLGAIVLSAVGRFKEADERFAIAWAGFEKADAREEMGRTGTGWVNVLTQLGFFEKADTLAMRARRLLPRKDKLSRARLDVTHTNVLVLSGQYRAAVERLRAALRVFQSAGFEHDAALVTYNLAYALALLGRLKEARSCYESAEIHFREHGLTVQRINAACGIALVDMMVGSWEGTMERLEDLNAELEQLGDIKVATHYRRSLAEVLCSLGILEEAERLASKTHDAYRQLGLRVDTAQAAFLHGRILGALRRNLEARVRLEDALHYWREIGEKRAIHRTEVELAAVLLARNETDVAFTLLRSAKRYLTRYDRKGSSVRCRHLIAEAYLQKGRHKDAERMARAALTDARFYPARYERPWIALTLARSLAAPATRTEANRWVRRSVREMEKLYLALGTQAIRGQLSASRETIYQGVVEVIHRIGGRQTQRTALDLLSRARSPLLVEDLLRGKRKLSAPLRAGIARLRDQLLDMTDPGPEEIRADRLRNQLEVLERSLARVQGNPPQIVERAQTARGFREWSQHLSGRSLVFYDWNGTDWSAYVVDEHRRVRHVSLDRVSDVLTSAWNPLRLLLGQAAHLPAHRRREFLADTMAEAKEAMLQLRGALWDPLALQPGDVYTVPTEALHGLPIECLPLIGKDGEGSANFEEGESEGAGHWHVSRLPHPAVLATLSRSKRRRGALLLHDGTPGTRQEVERIGEILRKEEMQVRKACDRDELGEGNDRLGVLHVAAHGSYHREEWLLNGIRLRDGWLGFEHLPRSRLSEALIVFGSCESGLRNEPHGSEFGGWITAGLGAGAAELILALWKIDDAAATAFAESFYAAWCRGMSAREAADAARLDVRRRFPHPFSWAPFVCVG